MSMIMLESVYLFYDNGFMETVGRIGKAFINVVNVRNQIKVQVPCSLLREPGTSQAI